MLCETGSLKITGERGGSIPEITEFLSDLEGAYIAIYIFQQQLYIFDWRWYPKRLRGWLPRPMLIGLAFLVWWQIGWTVRARMAAETIPPQPRLFLEHVRIESPGFWEFAGSLNPLQQIRGYLNDRHQRRQDREFREPLEKERLILENELIRRQIGEKDNSIVRERIAILREIGYTDNDIDQLIWSSIGGPMTRLGRHQDTGLIGGSE